MTTEDVDMPLHGPRHTPVPTLGMRLVLHAHRVAPVKYTRCMELLGIPADTQHDLWWESSTREAILFTSRLWNSYLQADPYIRGGPADESPRSGGSITDEGLDTEYNLSVKVSKQQQQPQQPYSSSSRPGSHNGSLSGDIGTLRSSLAGSRGSRKSAGKKVVMVTVDGHDV
eukprot:CAMPEP_0176458568 /NCGR_PEP_ID=MMETSP0127-20121128/32682_1 /TAXON_ID=938130 /ORGANISM="Platyophrya macrostoma, Strain WH" /LENGTH=170 /DNA_ID=CAMNT_0017849185 /DNA_START=18 /DNA_END=530 /DNA_ORIENTATION=+